MYCVSLVTPGGGHIREKMGMARRAAEDRAPCQAVAPAVQEPDRLRAGHRLAVLHHRHQHPRIPATGGVPGVPGSHQAQFIDVLHRQHAVVKDDVRARKSMGLRNVKNLGREQAGEQT